MYSSKRCSTCTPVTICIWFVWIIFSWCDGFRTSYFRSVPDAADMEPKTGIMEDFLNYQSVSLCNTGCLIHGGCLSFFYNRFQKRCILTGAVNISTLQSSVGFSLYVIDDCIRSVAGWDYNGELHHTVNGRLCQRWDQQSPHSHNYGSLVGYENFCRNSHLDFNETAGPWCFTMDSNVRWESCGIPLCYDFTRNCSTTSNGVDYYGKANVTTNGEACAFWSDTSTQSHSYTFLADQHNYCRNPFGAESAPWCYTSISWGYCDINAC